MPSPTREVVVLAHPVLDAINEDEILAAVDKDTVVREIVEVAPGKRTFREFKDADWRGLALLQEQIWKERVAPALRQYPQADILYFGLAPVPLAFHLGTLVEGLRNCDAYQRHHRSRRWSFADCAESTVCGPVALATVARSADPAIVSVSTTAEADVDDLLRRLTGVSCQLEVRAEPLGPDNLSREAMHSVVEQFQLALSQVENRCPNAASIHVLAAVPCGVAFLMGAIVTSTRHGTFVLYQYSRDTTPKQIEALQLPLLNMNHAKQAKGAKVSQDARTRLILGIAGLAVIAVGTILFWVRTREAQRECAAGMTFFTTDNLDTCVPNEHASVLTCLANKGVTLERQDKTIRATKQGLDVAQVQVGGTQKERHEIDWSSTPGANEQDVIQACRDLIPKGYGN